MTITFSGKDVNKAGELLKKLNSQKLSSEEIDWMLEVTSFWRFSHDVPLDNAFEKVKAVVVKKDSDAIFAKRRKRFVSIRKKLLRFDGMTLRGMQDIGGCRAIVGSEKKLRQCVRELKKLPEFKLNNGYRIKDYIKHPKDDGYRSFHLVGMFKDQEGGVKRIEVQLRTKIQHSWATALEIVDLFTGQALKSNQGDEDWKDFFRESSKQFAILEKIHLYDRQPENEKAYKYLQLVNSDADLSASRAELKRLAKKTHVLKMLNAFAGSLKVIREQHEKLGNVGYVLVQIIPEERKVNLDGFAEDDSDLAEKAYLEAEKAAAKEKGLVVALVSSSSVGGIEAAYPNFFADSSVFDAMIKLIVDARY